MAELRLALDGPLARVVHDLRGPLQVIRGECFALSRRAASGRQRAGLAAIDAEAVRLSDALEDLLRLAEPTAPGVVDLAAIAAAAARRGSAAGRPSGVRVRLRETCGRPLPVAGDARALARALDNLLGNAVRHSPRGGWVVIEVGRDDDGAAVLVRDRGPGIPAPDRERVFAPGERGRDPVGRGAGLGLAIAREVAEAHGGRLELLERRRGAAFILRLPIAGR